MGLTLKVYYEKADGNKEIRRFPLNTSQGGDVFKIATDKIKHLYPDLSNGDFQLFWQDSDGDRIVFSCAEEMQEAMRQVQDGVLRIYVLGNAPKTGSKSSSAPKPEQVSGSQANSQNKPQKNSQEEKGSKPSEGQNRSFHRGVVCDGCDGPVQGIRYKCCICPDYDLCEVCEGNGRHNEHDMFKIPKPMRPSGWMPPHMGHHFQHFMNGFNSQSDQGQKPGEQGGNTGGNTDSSGRDNCGGRNKSQFNEYLNSVGANIAAFLDPFGIDVTYDVHDGDSGCTMGTRGGWGGKRRGGGRNRRFKRRTSSSGQDNDQKASDREKTTMTSGGEKPASDAQKVNEETAGFEQSPQSPMDTNVDKTEQTTSNSANTFNEEWTFIPEAGSEVPIFTSPPASQSIPMPGPSSLNTTSAAIPMPAPPSMTSPTAPPTMTSSAPAIPLPAPPSYSSSMTSSTTSSQSQTTEMSMVGDRRDGLYPDLRVQQSLDQMLAMGFTNTDGWLAQLLTEHQGDIGATLDAIKVKATQQLHNLRDAR